MSAPRRLYFLLNRAQHALRRGADRQCGERLGVSSVQVGALYTLQASPGCSQRRLAEALGLDESAATGMVGRMEAKGLVRRRRHPDDARTLQLELAPAGRRVLARLGPLLDLFNRRLEAGFRPEELDAVRRFLETAIERAADPEALWGDERPPRGH